MEKDKDIVVEQGFIIVPQLFPKVMVQQAVATIVSTLAQYAQALSLPLAHYLYCTGYPAPHGYYFWDVAYLIVQQEIQDKKDASNLLITKGHFFSSEIPY